MEAQLLPLLCAKVMLTLHMRQDLHHSIILSQSLVSIPTILSLMNKFMMMTILSTEVTMLSTVTKTKDTSENSALWLIPLKWMATAKTLNQNGRETRCTHASMTNKTMVPPSTVLPIQRKCLSDPTFTLAPSTSLMSESNRKQSKCKDR